MGVARVGINGFGTIGKRVADAVLKQPDMRLMGIVKITPDYGAKIAVKNGIPVYTLQDRLKEFEKKGIKVAGTIEDLLSKVDVIVDATPGGTGKKYKPLYEKYNVKMIFQGGEKADVAEVSFNTLCNYEEALNKRSVRVVSCNTTGLLRALCSLLKIVKIESVRAVIVRRAADPKEIKRGPVNAIVPDPAQLPSHHADDVKTVLRDIDIITAAVVVPTTLMHVHIVYARLTSTVKVEDIVDVFETTPRIVLVDSGYGLKSTADIIEAARDLGRKRSDVPELIIWRESITVNNKEIMWIQGVHQESIVVPENVDAIRAVTGLAQSAVEAIKLTDTTLGIRHGSLV